MRKLVTAIALILSMSAAQAAYAGAVSFNVQNKITTDTIVPTYQSGCAISPTLAGVAPSSTSSVYVSNCGFSTGTVFDYTAGAKTCRFALYSIYNGLNHTWMPNGGASSRGTVQATCKVILTAIGTNGNYGFYVTME